MTALSHPSRVAEGVAVLLPEAERMRALTGLVDTLLRHAGSGDTPEKWRREYHDTAIMLARAACVLVLPLDDSHGQPTEAT